MNRVPGLHQIRVEFLKDPGRMEDWWKHWQACPLLPLKYNIGEMFSPRPHRF